MVFLKRRLKTTSTQCTRERKPTARGGCDTIHTDATTEVPAAAAGFHSTAAAGVHITTAAAATGIITAAAAAAAATGTLTAAAVHTAAAITATAGGLCFQTSLYCNYIGPHILWQDTFLQSSFAVLYDDDMAFSRENLVALQTLATVI